MASQRPTNKERKCLNLREPTRKICYIGTFLAALCIVFVSYTKITKQCFPMTPYPLCLANRHCAYIQKSQLNSYLDLLPFVQNGGRCIARNEYKDFLYKGVETTIDFFNWITSHSDNQKDQTLYGKAKELFLTAKESERLLSQFKYYYDEEVLMHLTRFEIGLWLIFAIMFLLRRTLNTCGNKKTVFDFMRANSLSKDKQPEVLLTPEQLRKLREELLSRKREMSKK